MGRSELGTCVGYAESESTSLTAMLDIREEVPLFHTLQTRITDLIHAAANI